MATLKQMKTNFVAGEIDPLMIARPDIKHYHNGAKKMRNVVAIPQGGFRTRPGSRYLHQVAAGKVRMASFQYTSDEAYLFVFTHNLLTIFYDDAPVATLVTPYSNNHLVSQFRANGELVSAGINWTQSLDQFIVYHESVKPRIIKRGGSHSSWTIEAASFDNMPRVDFGGTYTNGVDEVQRLEFPYRADSGAIWRGGDTFVLVLEDEETDPIQVTTSPTGSGTMAS